VPQDKETSGDRKFSTLPTVGWRKENFFCPKEPNFFFYVYGGSFLKGMKLTIPVHLVKVKFTV